MARVSIVMSVRNEEELVERSIGSLLNQSFRDFDLLVVDDGSTDRTASIVASIAARDPRVRWMTIEHRAAGGVRPRIVGVQATDGPIVAIGEADAWYDPHYLKWCLEALRAPGVGGVTGKIRVWEPRTWVSRTRDFHYRARWNDEEYIRREIEAGHTGVWVFPRRVYEEVGGYDPGAVLGEDRDLAARIRSKGYKVVYEPRALWYHKWEERPLRILRYYFVAGRQGVRYYLAKRAEFARRLFFLAPLVLLPAALLFPWLLLLLALQIGLLYARGLPYLKRADAHRGHLLLFPFYLYLFDIPMSLGFLYQLVTRKPLRATGNPGRPKSI